MSVGEFEELRSKIFRLKKEMNALIVAHNYQRPEVQDIADFVGDSLELARQGKETGADVIVLCGVRFMAENCVIVNPSRTVLLAEGSAGCPMADMIEVEDVREWRARYPKAAVVCYVNTSAAVKAESDVCCTSANALQVVDATPNDEIIFIPDQNLGHWVSTKTTKKVYPYPGFCVTHHRLTAGQVRAAREAHPEAKVIAHPECTAEVLALADAVLSTSQMIRYVKESSAKVFLVGTEAGLLHRMARENPDKTLYVISNALLCPNMKRTTLRSVATTMELERNVIKIPEEIRARAQRALERMLQIS
ncbi:MAG: quinolinate synthase NadA [Chloroflexi bacterium]|nr:quinolinate synthase NadA [Chloroflexota bacterium]